MHQDDELDFGEDDLVLQPAPAHFASSLDQVDPDSAASTSTAHQGSAAPPSTTMTSLNATAPGATTTTAAGAAHAATVSAHQLAPASAAQSAASTPPVQPKKPHDESLDALGNKLPQGWVSRVSKSTGNVYYRNTVLNTSAWDIPTEPAVPAQPAPVVAPVAPVVAAPAEQAPVAAVPAPAAPVLAPEQAPAPVALEPVPQQQPQHETQMQDVQSPDASAPSAPAAPKPRVFVHPDRLKFADPEAAASSTSSFAPPTGPRGGSSMYPARRTSTATQDLAAVSTSAPVPPTGPRASLEQQRHALPPQDQIVAPTAPARRRGGRSGRRSVGGDGFAANQIPVGTPRGPRVGGAAEQGTPGAPAGLDDRWAASPAPAAVSAVDASEPRFAVPSGPRAGRDRPPHIAAAAASTPSLNRYPSSSASATLASPVAEPGSALSPPTTRRTLYSPATDRDASLDPHSSSRLPAPSESASPGPERGHGRQQSLGAVSASSGLSQAEKLEQQRLARLAATGGPSPSLSALDVAPSVSSDRFAPSFGSVDAAGGSADRFAPRGGRRGRGGRGGRDGAAAPAAVLAGANSMPVGAAGGGWGDRARIAREKLEREEREARERDEARDAARREQIKRDAEDDERRRMRAEEADVVLGRERERKRLEDEAEAREKERRASAYGARGAGGRGAGRHSRSPERETSSRRRSMSPPPRRRSPSPPPRRRSPSPPARRRDYSPPPSMGRGRDYSPPPATGRGRSPSPPLMRMRMRSRSPPPHLRRRGGGGGQRSPSPGRLPPLRFPMGNILDKSSSALRGRFRDPEADAAGPDSSLIRSAGPMMPLGDGRRAPFDDVDSPKKRRARGGKSRRGRASEGMYLDEADRGGARRERSLSPRRGEREDDLRGGGSRWNGDGRGGSLASPIPRPGPSLLSRLGGTGSSLPDKPGPSSSSSAGKRVRDPEEVIREEEKRKRL